jgi:hypothetical protein
MALRFPRCYEVFLSLKKAETLPYTTWVVIKRNSVYFSAASTTPPSTRARSERATRLCPTTRAAPRHCPSRCAGVLLPRLAPRPPRPLSEPPLPLLLRAPRLPPLLQRTPPLPLLRDAPRSPLRRWPVTAPPLLRGAPRSLQRAPLRSPRALGMKPTPEAAPTRTAGRHRFSLTRTRLWTKATAARHRL